MRAMLILLASLNMGCGRVQAQALDTAFIFFNARMLMLTDAYEISMRQCDEVQAFIDGNWDYGFHIIQSTGYPANYVFCKMNNSLKYNSE